MASTSDPLSTTGVKTSNPDANRWVIRAVSPIFPTAPSMGFNETRRLDRAIFDGRSTLQARVATGFAGPNSVAPLAPPLVQFFFALEEKLGEGASMRLSVGKRSGDTGTGSEVAHWARVATGTVLRVQSSPGCIDSVKDAALRTARQPLQVVTIVSAGEELRAHCCADEGSGR